MTQEQPTASRKKVTLEEFYGIIRFCNAKGDHTVQKLAIMTQTKKHRVIYRLREKKSDLPDDIAAMPWVRSIIETKSKFARNPMRYRPPVANSKVRIGAAQQISVLNGKEKKPVSLPKLPQGLHVEGADQWGIIARDGVRP